MVKIFRLVYPFIVTTHSKMWIGNSRRLHIAKLIPCNPFRTITFLDFQHDVESIGIKLFYNGQPSTVGTLVRTANTLCVLLTTRGAIEHFVFLLLDFFLSVDKRELTRPHLFHLLCFVWLACVVCALMYPTNEMCSEQQMRCLSKVANIYSIIIYDGRPFSIFIDTSKRHGTSNMKRSIARFWLQRCSVCHRVLDSVIVIEKSIMLSRTDGSKDHAKTRSSWFPLFRGDDPSHIRKLQRSRHSIRIYHVK